MFPLKTLHKRIPFSSKFFLIGPLLHCPPVSHQHSVFPSFALPAFLPLCCPFVLYVYIIIFYVLLSCILFIIQHFIIFLSSVPFHCFLLCTILFRVPLCFFAFLLLHYLTLDQAALFSGLPSPSVCLFFLYVA